MQPALISVILATYNWPSALALVLQSLAAQDDRQFEIVLADDGSRNDTRERVEQLRAHLPVPLAHLWQDDLGFRKSLILNQAIAQAAGDYLVFLDGDCIVQPDFIRRHRALAEPGCMVTGSRVLLERPLSEALCDGGRWDFAEFRARLPGLRLRRQVNKLLPLYLKAPDHPLRRYRRFVWRRIKGCNMACWRADALAIHGFDEAFQGWGHEDADFVFRLHAAGVARKSGAWSTEVLHLWHPSGDRASERRNAARLRERIAAGDRPGRPVTQPCSDRPAP